MINHETYTVLRGYCFAKLPYLESPAWHLAAKLGDYHLLVHEQHAAMEIFGCADLEPDERAAAHLLAVASNARAIIWQREAVVPRNKTLAKPLTPAQREELSSQLVEAVEQFACHLPEREARQLIETVRRGQAGTKLSPSEARLQAALSIVAALSDLDQQITRDNMPGTKKDFFELCKELDKQFRFVTEATFNGDIKGSISFRKGTRSGDTYKRHLSALLKLVPSP